MKLKDRIKTYNFWVSLSSAVFLILKLLGEQFGFNVDEGLFSDVFTTLCGILVILGIIVPPTSKDNQNSINSNVIQENVISKDESQAIVSTNNENIQINSPQDIERLDNLQLEETQTAELQTEVYDEPTIKIEEHKDENNLDEFMMEEIFQMQPKETFEESIENETNLISEEPKCNFETQNTQTESDLNQKLHELENSLETTLQADDLDANAKIEILNQLKSKLESQTE